MFNLVNVFTINCKIKYEVFQVFYINETYFFNWSFFLIQWKSGEKVDKIWPYIHQEIKPTLEELGIPTPEECGYDKPELALKRYEDMTEEV